MSLTTPQRRQTIFLLLLASLWGCATYDDPKDYQPSATTLGTGRVCVYRIARRSTPGAWQDWYLDGRRRGEIMPGLNTCIETHVGRHIVRRGIASEAVEFTLDKGQTVFVRFDADSSLFGRGIHPVLVDPQTAARELESFRR